MNKRQRQPKSGILELFKPGIIFVVLVTGLAGYALSFEVEHEFRLVHFFSFVFGLLFLSAGSFAVNQAQEWAIDSKMPRTQKRPIPAGNITPSKAYWLGFLLVALGSGLLLLVSPLASGLGLLTALFYNGFYTLFWKRKWAFGAVPGALPGAMPVMIGYAANSSQIFSRESLYMFAVMFLWQMPHFWSLAIRFKDDYKAGGIPVLPSTYGVQTTLFHIGLYVFVYVALAIATPWFVTIGHLYLVVVLPFALKVLWEFFKYNRPGGEVRWLPFFMWVNFSLLVFLIVPVVEKWGTFFMSL